MEARKTELGSNHLNTPKSMDNHERVSLEDQGQYTNALAIDGELYPGSAESPRSLINFIAFGRRSQVE